MGIAMWHEARQVPSWLIFDVGQTMIKPEFPLERFLEIVLPGAVLTVGVWYLHRPFLSVYFPTIASIADSGSGETASLVSKATVLLCVTIIVGMVVRNLSDIGVASLFTDESASGKSRRALRRLARIVARLFLVKTARDPRIHAIERYLSSPRRDRFLKLAAEWGFCTETALDRNDEKVVVHQHLVTRVKVHSAEARALLSEAFQPVTVFSGLFVSHVALFSFALLSFATNATIEGRAVAHSKQFLGIGLAVIYLATVAVAYAVRRAMRQFSAQVMTLALHLHASTEEPNKAPEPTTTAVTPRAS